MLRQLDSVTKAVALEKSTIFVDLGNYTDWVDTDFYDFSHMTPQGARKLGILLHEQLGNIVTGGE